MKFITRRVVRLPQVAQTDGRCCIHSIIQGQVVWKPKQPALVADVLADCRGLVQMTLKGPFQPKLLADSVIQPKYTQPALFRQPELLLTTAPVLKAEHVPVFAEPGPKGLHKARDEAGHSFLCSWVRKAKPSSATKLKSVLACCICSRSATGGSQFGLSNLWA